MNTNEETPIEESIEKRAYEEAFRRVLDRIHHEDTLVDRRLNWLLTSQSILFATYEIAVNLGTNSTGSILQFIAPLALGICILSYASLLAALFAIYAFCKQLHKEFPRFASISKQNILGPTITHLIGQASAFFLPIAFIGVWVFIWSQSITWSVIIVILILIGVITLWTQDYRNAIKGTIGK